jgi:hypothetical protein
MRTCEIQNAAWFRRDIFTESPLAGATVRQSILNQSLLPERKSVKMYIARNAHNGQSFFHLKSGEKELDLVYIWLSLQLMYGMCC